MNLNRIYSSLLTVLLSLLVCTTLQGQIRLAVLGGVQSTDLIQHNSIPGFDTASGKYYSPNTGFELGVLAEIPFGKNNLFLQPGILYSAKGNQYSRYYDSSVYTADTLYNQHILNLNYVELPLYITWKLPLSKDRKSQFYISGGPYFAFIYGASQSYQTRIKEYNTQNYVYNSGTTDLPVGNGIEMYKTFDIGISARAGFELGTVLIGAYFSRGLTNAYTASYPSSFHNQVFGGSLGIWLNKVKPLPEPVKDADKDGTPDPDDSCKTIAGIPKYHGCPIPDSDHDGINDEEDSCKSIPGTARYHGCPIPDRDGDGIDDERDKCPDQPGPRENQGCPLVKAAIIARAQIIAANVMFDVNSARLTRNSYPAIKEIADSLKTNPDLDLMIEGHTDNTGDPAYNKKLSLERTNAVKNVLLGLGIAENRIYVKGYGDTQPIAENKTAAGRAKNRRVVFVFQLKNR